MFIALSVIAVLVVAALLFIKRSMSNDVNGLSDTSFWDRYTLKFPDKAAAILEVTGINMSSLTDNDVKEIVGSIERWSKNSKCSIRSLKQNFLGPIIDMMKEEEELTWDYVLNDLKFKRMKEEASVYNIKQDHTISRFMIDAVVEYQQKLQHDNLSSSLATRLGLTDEQMKQIEQTEKELNLAPDISKNNNLENRLFKLAKTCVDRLSKEFKPLSDVGRAEALLFFSTLILDLGEFKNELDMDKMEDKYKLLLNDEVFTEFDVNDIFAFLNSRKKFYTYQYRKLKRERMYTPMFIYNAFYMNPGCEQPDYLSDFNESPFVLLGLQAQLYELESFINDSKKSIE